VDGGAATQTTDNSSREYLTMNEASNPSDPLGDPVDAFVRLIRGRHKAGILIRLGKAGAQRRRYSELCRAIPTASPRVLSRQLAELEQEGLIERFVFAQVPPRVEYALTVRGKTLCPVIKHIWKWGVADSSH
jgi:DNA-binding HxlR family transcriptional regulator